MSERRDARIPLWKVGVAERFTRHARPATVIAGKGRFLIPKTLVRASSDWQETPHIDGANTDVSSFTMFVSS